MQDIEEAPRDRVGFKRAEMNSEPLPGTVKFHNMHLFVVASEAAKAWKQDTAKDPASAHALLTAAVHASGLGTAKVTLCEADGSDAPGDVLVFPREGGAAFRLSPSASMLADAPAWAAEVVAGAAAGGDPQAATCVFVCAHARRDARCGATGPALVSALREALAARAAAGDARAVVVRACSHVGGHAFAGNVLVFARRGGEAALAGDWYGYVTPEHVTSILDERIRDGKQLDAIWRGAQGMTPDACVACAQAAACRPPDASVADAAPASSCALS